MALDNNQSLIYSLSIQYMDVKMKYVHVNGCFNLYLNSTDRIPSKQTNIRKQQQNYCCILNNYEILVDHHRYAVFLWNQS